MFPIPAQQTSAANGMKPPKRLSPRQLKALRDEGYSDDEIQAEGYVLPYDLSGVQSRSSTAAPRVVGPARSAELSDADLWEELVDRGLSEQDATARVLQRRQQQAPKRKRLRPDQYQWAKDNGYSDEELTAEGYDLPADFSGVQSGSSTTARPRAPSKLASFGRGAAEGATLGGSDEAAAMLSFHRDEDAPAIAQRRETSSEPGGTLGQRYQQFKSSREAARAANPGAYLGGELTGTVASMAVPGTSAARAPTLMRRMLQAGKAGAAIGGASGALSTEGDLTERAKGAAFGGAIGGVGSAIATPVIEGVARAPAAVLSGLGAATGFATGDGWGDRFRNAAVGGALLGGPKTIASTARAMVSPRFSAGDVLRSWMGRPPINATNFADDLAKATGIARPNVPKELATMRVDQLAQSSPEYRALWAANAEPVRDPALLDMIQQSPTLREAERRAIKTMREFKLPVARVETPTGKATAPTPQMLHFMKMEVDKDIERLVAGKVRPGQSTDIAAKTQTLGAFRDYVEQLVPGYAEANATFAASSARLKALQQGSKAWSKSADEIEFLAQNMSPEELQAFRTGLASHVYKQLAEAKPGADVLGKLLGTEVGVAGAPDRLRKLRVLFPDDETFQTFVSRVLQGKRPLGAKTFAAEGTATNIIARTPALMQRLVGGAPHAPSSEQR